MEEDGALLGTGELKRDGEEIRRETEGPAKKRMRMVGAGSS